MDPNENLKRQREIVSIMRALDSSDPSWRDAADELADLVEALDFWLRNGGFLPQEWAR